MKPFLLAVVCLSIVVLPEIASAQKVRKVDFAKKIAEATPPELPQSPIADRAGTDARDTGLKGRVKSVIETTQEAGKRTRDGYKDAYYNESGNLIKTVDYSDGYPDSVTVYGFIDKMRVTRSRDVTYAEGEKPEPKGIFMRMSDNAKDPSAPRDTRYDRRKVYEYDSQGRLIAESSYQNNESFGTKRLLRTKPIAGRSVVSFKTTVRSRNHCFCSTPMEATSKSICTERTKRSSKNNS